MTALVGQADAADAPSSACGYLTSLLPAEGPPIFLASYPTVQGGALYNTAYLYDDSVAAIALVGCGEIERARRIGDAILASLDHDRFWHDGRLRNAYAAAPATDNPIKLAGWWEPKQQRWLEDSYQVGSDSGNMAWAMLALMSLDRAGSGPQYRVGAQRIGAWVAARADTRGAGGFTGGFDGWEPAPSPMAWKSTEHNTDLAAAFARLAKADPSMPWTTRAGGAAGLVKTMWDKGCACFFAGTAEDGVTHNPIMALDAQIWPLLAVPGLYMADGAAVLATVEAKLRADGGYAYGAAKGGMWTEGTAYVALLLKLTGQGQAADTLMALLATQRSADGYYATNVKALPTGFALSTDPTQQRYYYHVPHLAAAAWTALAEQAFNPFTGTRTLP